MRVRVRLSIFQALVLVFVVIVIIPLTISFIVSQKTVNDLVISQVASETMNSIDLATDSVNSLLQKMYSLAMYVNDDENVRELIDEETEDADNSTGRTTETLSLRKLERIKKFDNFISNIGFNTMGIRSYITIVTQTGGHYTNLPFEGGYSNEYKRRMDAGKLSGEIWVKFEQNYVRSESKQSPYVVTLGKNLLSTTNKTFYGTFMISVTENTFSELLSANNKDLNRLILDEDLCVISATQKHMLGHNILDLYDLQFPSTEKGSFGFTDQHGQELIVTYSTLRDWKIVDIKSYASVTGRMSGIQSKVLLFNVATILIFIVMATLIVRNINKNRELMKHNIDIERNKREAELKALQAQISPHFLFNTLNAIRWAAINNHNKKAADMVLALSNLLRMTIAKGDEFISIADEFENLRNYAALFQMRYAMDFTLDFSVPEELLTYKIPKLLLQPLVENSIMHGLEGMLGGGVIRIDARSEQNGVYISVSDNGIGMEHRAEQPREDTKELKFSGIGITNVEQRIKLYFGEQYGLEITSSPGHGTVVEISLPKQESGEFSD